MELEGDKKKVFKLFLQHDLNMYTLLTKQLTVGVILFLLTICSPIFAQYIVIDANTKQPVPKVKIELGGENKGITSGEDCKFYLPKVDKNIFVTLLAEGYEVKKIQVSKLPLKISLSPENRDIVQIVKEKQEKIKVVSLPSGPVKEYPSWYGNSGLAYTIARYIPNKITPFKALKISDLKFITSSPMHNSTFNVAFYEVNEKREPGKKLHTSTIVGIANKGVTVTEIDVSYLNLEMQENGIFIALEYLVIDSNKYVSKSRVIGHNEKEVVSYKPSFGMVFLDSEGESFSDVFGRWKKEQKLKGGQNQGKVTAFAVEMTLTD